MREHLFKIILLLIGIAAVAVACRPKAAQITAPVKTSVIHADWTRNMVLYEINVRQFSAEGTFAAVEEALPRLKELGVNVLWLMPIHPIGEINRKGELGSYYSITDYKGVNPEFGTLDDLRSLVERAHEMDFHVILDWVGNHSAWDSPLAEKYPEWYEKGADGSFVSPYDWTDVIQFDYTAEPLWDYMIGAMRYWVEEVAVDGYRCDFPGLVPEEFWYRATSELNAIKPVLMLAEDESHSLLLERAFDMNYAWAHHHLMNAVAGGERRPAALDSLLSHELVKYDPEVYRLRFMTNHDENSWNGTINEQMGEAQRALACYLFTIPGVPLLYNGQEADLDKRLLFFERDPIEWKESELTPFYTTLVHLRTSHPALRHGNEGGSYERLKSNQKSVIAYKRVKGDEEVLTILNLSGRAAKVTLRGGEGSYRDIFTGKERVISSGDRLQMEPWGYMVMTR